jgi:hypothetical protein
MTAGSEDLAADRAPLLAAIHVGAAIASVFSPDIFSMGGGSGDGFEAEAPSNPANPLRINRYASAEPSGAGPFAAGSLY